MISDQPPGPYSIGSRHWPGLGKLVEEGGELAGAAGRLIASGGSPEHWFRGPVLVVELEDELADAIAAIQFFIDANNLDADRITARADEKERTYRAWHAECLTAGAFGR